MQTLVISDANAGQADKFSQSTQLIIGDTISDILQEINCQFNLLVH